MQNRRVSPSSLIVLFFSCLFVSLAAFAGDTNRARITSYYDPPYNDSDSATISVYLSGDIRDYCNAPVTLEIMLWSFDWAGGDLLRQTVAPVGGPKKCRYLGTSPGIRDLVFEQIDSPSADDSIYMTLLVDNRGFNWPAAIKNELTSPDATGGEAYYLDADVFGQGIGTGFVIPVKLCDYNERKLQLCGQVRF